MIKCVLTFVSGVQESASVRFYKSHKVKILHEVKICQNCLYQKFPNKNEQICIFKIFFLIFELLLKFYAQFHLILNL